MLQHGDHVVTRRQALPVFGRVGPRRGAFLGHTGAPILGAERRKRMYLTAQEHAQTSCSLIRSMTWLQWLALAVIITAVAAITGIKPRGTRHVAHTRMMGV